MAEAVAVAGAAQEVAEEATSIFAHLINIIRQVLSWIYDQIKMILTFMAKDPMAFSMLCVNMAIIFGT